MTEPTLESVIPGAAEEAVHNAVTEDFKSTLKLPKGVNRYLVARAVDKMILTGKPIEQVRKEMGLVASEADYATKCVAEFLAWQDAQKAKAAPTHTDLMVSPEAIAKVTQDPDTVLVPSNTIIEEK